MHDGDTEATDIAKTAEDERDGGMAILKCGI